ncbi:MAG TPA: glycosyltransferase family 4 protein [candidate division Zixibacteria bacterium]|nr:glycosyltransferase family 4 protein [candidate division Zixibacteria bacterium]
MTEIKTNKPGLAFLCDTHSWGGLEMNVLRLARWLAERGWPTAIYGDPKSPLGITARDVGLPVVRPHKIGGLAGAYFKARWLIGRARRDKIGWLISNLSRDRLTVALARRLCSDSFRLMNLQHMHLGANKRDPIHNWQYRSFDAWIAPLPMFKKRVAAATVIPPERIHVIPYGIVQEPFVENLPDRIEARVRLKLPTEGIVIGNIGRLDPKKGQDTLIEAVAGLHRSGLSVHVLLVGDRTAGEAQEYEQKLNAMIERLGLNGFVHQRPFMADVETAYAALDIFVLTSHSETFGMVTVEAMASGRAVVATAEGGTVEIVTDGKTGRLFPPQSASALENCLRELIEHPEERERLARSAREEAMARFDHRLQVAAMERVLLKPL